MVGQGGTARDQLDVLPATAISPFHNDLGVLVQRAGRGVVGW